VETRAAVGNEPVSIIICARNEEENLKKFLPSVLTQEYGDYEVIVVNDCSEDGSYIILGEYIAKYSHLRVSTITKDPKFTHNKKFAQFIGIKAAKNEILLFTDADCQPVSDKWLAGMVGRFDDKANFVLGYGGYFEQGGFLNKIIRCDTLFIAMQYLGMAIRGFPYMGVGRNLAYRKSLFFKNKGFGAHSQLPSGDDDLFVNSNASEKDTRVEYSIETHTRSVPCTEFSEWLNQKKRHITTAPFYKFRDRFLLNTEPASRLVFYTAFIVLVSTLTLWPIVLAIFMVRLIVQIVVYAKTQKRLNEKALLAYSLIFDILSPFLYGVVYLSNLLSKPDKNGWK
jgi:glycosyltransferase involved in cell wall biosynthesis